jgi:magnesium transporter
MEAERQLTRAFLQAHPEDAARRLEQLGVGEMVALLEEMPVGDDGVLLERLTPSLAADCLARLSPERVGALLSHLPLDTAAALLRRVGQDDRDLLLTHAPEAARESLSLVLRFPEKTAGSLMDPRALSVPDDVLIRQARHLVRCSAQHLRYYIYVIDREQKLVGVLTLRELFISEGKRPVSAVMNPHVQRLSVLTDQVSILVHPGWQQVHSLPVVDENGVFLGAIRYETLRRLEGQRGVMVESRQAVSLVLALGELYWTAMDGMLRSLGPGAPAALPPVGGKDNGS